MKNHVPKKAATQPAALGYTSLKDLTLLICLKALNGHSKAEACRLLGISPIGLDAVLQRGFSDGRPFQATKVEFERRWSVRLGKKPQGSAG